MRTKEQNALKFIGVDGEGITVAGEHRYVMLSAARADGSSLTIKNPTGLPSHECFDFLLQLKADWNGVLCGFSFGYDINMMLRDMPLLDAMALARTNFGYVKHGPVSYQIRNVPGKWVDIRRGHWKHRRFHGETASVRVYDVFGFFQKSFVKSLDDWEIGQLDVVEEIARMKEERGAFTLEEMDDIEAYNVQECVLLAQLMHRLDATFREAGISLKSYHGAGAAGAALMTRERITTHVEPHPNEATNGVMRAYFGGRIQCIQQGVHDARVWAHDINSAYPHAMLTLPSLHGSWSRVTEYDGSEYAVWHCAWDIDENYPIGPFPFRKHGVIHYPTKGEGWYWNPEVNVARRFFEIQVLEGWVFTPSSDIKPFAFVEDTYERRRQYKATGDQRHIALKLSLNSLYGKTAQSQGWNGNRPPFQSFVWAGLITATCRSRILELCMRDPESVITIATDGILATKPLVDDQGTTFGGWEVRPYENAFVFGPGRYYLGLPDGTRVQKSRGFMSKELPYELLRAAWDRKKIAAMIDIPVERFIGVKAAAHYKKWHQWRTWAADARVLKADQYTRGVPLNYDDQADIIRWVTWRFNDMSEPYRAKDEINAHKRDDAEGESQS